LVDGAGCTTKSGVFIIICSAVTVVIVSITLPFATARLIHKHRPRGSWENKNITHDEQGHEVEFTDELYRIELECQMDSNDAKYNPYAFLYYGYERNWAYYKVMVMILKTLVCIPVIVFARHPKFQATATISLITVWGAGSVWASPFIEDSADQLDLVSRFSQWFTVAFAMIAIYASGAEGAMGVLASIVNIVALLLLGFLVLRSTHWWKLKMKNRYGEFSYNAYSIKSRFETPVRVTEKNIYEINSSTGEEVVPLKWDLRRETKARIWQKFWDGFFAELSTEFKADPEAEAHAMVERFAYFKEQVKDVGVKKIMRWRSETDTTIEWARNMLLGELEGIDVYVGQECLLDDNLLEIEGTAADKSYNSKTGFAKVWVQMFPLRAVVVYDDSDDRAILYDPSITRMCEMNFKNPEIIRRRRMRRKLRALSRASSNGDLCHYPFTEVIMKEVDDGTEQSTDANGNTTTKKKKKKVPVTFTFEKARVITGQNGGGDHTKKTYQNIEIDTSAGFSFRMEYSDGSGSTTEGEGGNWTGECASKTAEFVGLNDKFEDSPELGTLFANNPDYWCPPMLDCYEAAWMDYRFDLNAERGAVNSVLSDKFWPDIYNDAEMTQAKMKEILKGEPLLHKFVTKAPSAWNYVWSRMDFVQAHPSLCYWFVFWDDFWEQNWDMECLQGKEDVFSPNGKDSILYKCMRQHDLTNLLNTHGLLQQNHSQKTETCAGKKSFFFPALINKLYTNLQTAQWRLHDEHWSDGLKYKSSYVPWAGAQPVGDGPPPHGGGYGGGGGGLNRADSGMERMQGQQASFDQNRDLARQLQKEQEDQERLMAESAALAAQLAAGDDIPMAPAPESDRDMVARMAREEQEQQAAMLRDMEMARQLAEEGGVPGMGPPVPGA